MLQAVTPVKVGRFLLLSKVLSALIARKVNILLLILIAVFLAQLGNSMMSWVRTNVRIATPERYQPVAG